MKRMAKKVMVMMLVGIVIAASFFAGAQAKPAKVIITISCAGDISGFGSTEFNNSEGSTSSVQSNCAVSAASFPPNSDLAIEIINAGVTMGHIRVNLDDGVGDNIYKIEGSTADDLVAYKDDTGNDELYFNDKGGTNTERNRLIVNDGAGNDKYNVNGTALEVHDGAGDDKYKGKDISALAFYDLFTGDKDKIKVKTS